MTCTHHQIQTWRVADTYEPAMWSCTNCGQKFVPLTQQMIDDEALLRQALECLERSDTLGWQANLPVIQAIKERLG
jgi:hypothetical protein